MISRGRFVGGILFGGGISIAAFGTWEAARFFGRLAAGARTIEAGSAIFGVPPLGLCMAGFGLVMLMSDGARRPNRPTQAQIFGGTLLMGTLAIALPAAGPWTVDRLMRAQGYRLCDQRIGVRTVFSQWVADGTTCRNGIPSRVTSQPTISGDVLVGDAKR